MGKKSDQCFKQIFWVVWEKNFNSAILGLRNRKGDVVNQQAEVEGICFDFYRSLCKGKLISEEAIKEVLEELLRSFTKDMNEGLTKPHSDLEFFKVIEVMANGKALSMMVSH